MQNNTLSNYPPLDFISNLPGYFLWKNHKSEFIGANLNTAHSFGYKNIDSLIGRTDYDIKCPAVQQAENWRNQDQIVLKTKKPLLTINIEKYTNNKEIKLLIHKLPFLANTGKLGIQCYCIEISPTLLHKTSNYFHEKNTLFASSKQKDLVIVNSFPIAKLTIRESECLFYICRGATAKLIASILCISERTVESYISCIKDKTGCNKKSMLIEYCISNTEY